MVLREANMIFGLIKKIIAWGGLCLCQFVTGVTTAYAGSIEDDTWMAARAECTQSISNWHTSSSTQAPAHSLVQKCLVYRCWLGLSGEHVYMQVGTKTAMPYPANLTIHNTSPAGECMYVLKQGLVAPKVS